MVEIDDQAALDAYTRILDVIANRCGSDCAGLFAEPVISRSNGAASGRVDWYTRYEGTAKPFSELDQGTFNAVQRTLETRLAALRPLLFDEQFGPFISAAFNLASPESLLAVGGEPVILDWGLLPLALGVDRFSRERHFSAIMGPLAGRLPLPVLSRAEWVANQAPASPATGQSSAANMMQDQRPIPGVGVVSPSPRAPVTVVTAGNSARAAAIATGLALLAVGATYIPGLLSYTADAATAKALETNQGILDQLEARRKALEAALAEDCANPETRQKTQGLLPQDPTRLRVGSAPPTTSPTPSPAIPPVTVPGAPTAPGQTPAPVPQQAVPPPPTGPEGAPSTLAERIERGVAFVIASKDDDGNATWSS